MLTIYTEEGMKSLTAKAQAYSISEDGNYLIVSHNRNVTGSFAPKVCVFIRSGEHWIKQTDLIPVTSCRGDNFGVSVSISSDGGYAVVGSDRFTEVCSGQGAAYIFKRSGSAWTQQAKLLANNPTFFDHFGVGVDIGGDGDCVVVGAERRHCQNSAAYVFTRSGTVWTLQAELLWVTSADLTFGYRVAISSDASFVAAYSFYYSKAMPTKQQILEAYAFIKIADNWKSLGKFQLSTTPDKDFKATT